MNKNLLLLLKKEFSEFCKNKVFLIIYLLALIITFIIPSAEFTLNGNLFSLNNKKMVIIIILISSMMINQYVYDSCVNDFSKGGTIFLLNCKINVGISAISKSIISILIGFLFCGVNIKRFIGLVSLSSIPWILFYFLFVSLTTYLFSVLLRKENAIVYLIVISLSVCLFVFISLVTNYLVKFLIPLFFDVVVYSLLCIAFKSIRFRASLK